MKVVLILILATLTSCASLSGTDTKNLIQSPPAYFDLDQEFKPGSYDVKTRFGNTVKSQLHICSGRYSAIYRDGSGTYFIAPEDCKNDYQGGLWIPDDPAKHSYDLWLIIKRSKGITENSGILIDWLDSIEAGNFRKSGFKMISRKVIDNISIKKGNA